MTMASSIPIVRFVRCPKCRRLLTELADVPMYQCGGCGTILKSKYHNSSPRNVTVESFATNHFQNLPDNSSLMNGLTSLEKQMINSSSDAPSSEAFYVSSSNMENKQEKGEFPKTNGSAVEDKGKTKSIIQSQVDESIQIKGEFVKDEEVDKLGIIVARDEMESHIVNDDIGSKCVNGLRSPTTRKSQAYHNSISSSDDGSADTKSNKYRLLSRRTFRRKKSLDSVDNKTTQNGENIAESYLSSPDVEKQFEGNNISLKSPMEEFGSAIRGNFNLKKDACDRGTSFGSEEFLSVQNYPETECDEPYRTQNDSSLTERKYPEDDQLELLMKLDELRDQVGGLCDQRVEGKARSCYKGDHHPLKTHYTSRDLMPQMNRFPHHSCLHCLPPHLCCYDRLCRACPYSKCTDSPRNACAQPLCMVSNISSCCQGPQNHDHETGKIQHLKDNKKAPKRHCRPISGGAPFTICYKCLELLQLPADFLVSRRRLHKLQCGACSEVLLFGHMVPRTSKITSIADDGGRGDPFSYTEECAPSASKSYSTDAETMQHARKNSLEAIEERNGKQAFGIALHRLMGYSSAREILYQPSDISEGYESSEIEMQHSYQPSEESHVYYRPQGRGTYFMFHENSSRGASPNLEIHEEDESPEVKG